MSNGSSASGPPGEGSEFVKKPLCTLGVGLGETVGVWFDRDADVCADEISGVARAGETVGLEGGVGVIKRWSCTGVTGRGVGRRVGVAALSVSRASSKASGVGVGVDVGLRVGVVSQIMV